MNIKKIGIYTLTIIFLFQNSFVQFTNINILNNLDELLILFLAVFMFIKIVKKGKIEKNISILFFLVTMFSFIGILSCWLNSDFIFSRVILSNFLVIKFFILIMAICTLEIKEEYRNYIMDALELCCKLVMIVAIFNFCFPNLYKQIFSFAMVTKRFNITAITSLFYHPGRYGWFMLFMSIFYYSKYKNSKSNKDKGWMMICALFSVLSLRTKVIMSIIVIIIFECIINKKINIKKIIISLVILSTVMLVFRNVIWNTYSLYYTDTNGVSARQALNHYSIKIMKDYFPLGVGFGKYGSWYAKVYYSEYYYKYNMNTVYGLSPQFSSFATDTFWPSIIGETGLCGTFIYILCLLVLIFSLLKKRKKMSTSIWVNIAILSLIQAICESFGEPSFNSAPQNIFVALSIGLALSERVDKKNGENQNNSNNSNL